MVRVVASVVDTAHAAREGGKVVEQPGGDGEDRAELYAYAYRTKNFINTILLQLYH